MCNRVNKMCECSKHVRYLRPSLLELAMMIENARCSVLPKSNSDELPDFSKNEQDKTEEDFLNEFLLGLINPSVLVAGLSQPLVDKKDELRDGFLAELDFLEHKNELFNLVNSLKE